MFKMLATTMNHELPPSRRGLGKIKQDLMLDLSREIADIPQYNKKSCPDGLIDITSSVNQLMAKDMEKYVKRNINFDVSRVLKYGSTAGSPALLSATAKFFNHNFNPSEPILPSNILTTNGATPLLDFFPFAICDPGEAIMYTTPAYGMFKHDLEFRNNIRIVEVPCADGFDQFIASNAGELVMRFQSALQEAKETGIRVKGVLICNPCNPLGRCYSHTTLIQLARFCASNDMHLVSDEVYAMSVHAGQISETAEDLKPDGFASVMSIDKAARVDNRNIHVIYSASKDFGLGGLRLGFFITRNTVLKEAIRRLCMFTWVTTFSDYIFTKVLEDNNFTRRFFKTYQLRLRESYQYTVAFLHDHGISFAPANAGVFIWIDLSLWLGRLGESADEQDSEELQLTRWLIKEGVYLEPGEAFYSPESGHYRLVYTSELDTLKVGLNRLILALETLMKTADNRFSTCSTVSGDKTSKKKCATEQKVKVWQNLCFR